jgi:hypothetical protein
MGLILLSSFNRVFQFQNKKNGTQEYLEKICATRVKKIILKEEDRVFDYSAFVDIQIRKEFKSNICLIYCQCGIIVLGEK